MTTAILSIYKAQKSLQTKISSIDVPLVNWKKVCVIGFAMISVLLVFYAWQVNGLIKGSYLAESYENDIAKLSEENKRICEIFQEEIT